MGGGSLLRSAGGSLPRSSGGCLERSSGGYLSGISNKISKHEKNESFDNNVMYEKLVITI